MYNFRPILRRKHFFQELKVIVLDEIYSSVKVESNMKELM